MNKDTLNLDIKYEILKSGFKNYEIAEKIGMYHTNFSVWFRTEMSEERKNKIRAAIKELEKERG